MHAAGQQVAARARQSSIAARMRSVTLATVKSPVERHRNIRFRVLGDLHGEPTDGRGDDPDIEELAHGCLPAATTAALSSALRSRGMVSESKIVIGMNHDFRTSSFRFDSLPVSGRSARCETSARPAQQRLAHRMWRIPHECDIVGHARQNRHPRFVPN